MFGQIKHCIILNRFETPVDNQQGVPDGLNIFSDDSVVIGEVHLGVILTGRVHGEEHFSLHSQLVLADFD